MKLLLIVCVFGAMSVFCDQVEEPGTEELTMDEQIISAFTSGKAADFIQSGDTLLVELDVILTPQQWATRTGSGSNRVKRAGLPGQNWPDNTIPYEKIAKNQFSDADITLIKEAFGEYHRYTCLTFRPKQQGDFSAIYFYEGLGCSSPLGYWKHRNHTVSLAQGCRTHGVIVHELGHTVGMHHEQTRPDRDDFVTLNETNIDEDMLYNFRKYRPSGINSRNIGYDYLSIMHYGGGAFALDSSKPSMVAIDSRYQHRMGQRFGLSFEDLQLINGKYNCAGHCPKKTCPDGGFLSKDCTCWCKKNVEFGEPVAICETGDRVPGGKPDGGFGTCGDKKSKRSCDHWKKNSMCSNRHASYMMRNCRETCGWCDDIGTDGTDTATTESIETSGGDVSILEGKNVCTNGNERCVIWAGNDYCDSHKSYMNRVCKRSCGRCGDGVLTGLACENDTLDLACRDNKVIKIKSAMFGRRDRGTCATGATSAQLRGDCEARDSLLKTKLACQGKTYCTITANSFKDQCPDTFKYLVVDYKCVEKKKKITKQITAACEDEHPSCNDWESAGFCTDSRHAPYMTRACKKSCKLCDKKGQSCKDLTANCSRFKAQGDCESNPHWSMTYCKKSCKFCGGYRSAKRKCEDTNQDCAPWVARGMCQQNKEYMRLNCGKSCGFCK